MLGVKEKKKEFCQNLLLSTVYDTTGYLLLHSWITSPSCEYIAFRKYGIWTSYNFPIYDIRYHLTYPVLILWLISLRHFQTMYAIILFFFHCTSNTPGQHFINEFPEICRPHCLLLCSHNSVFLLRLLFCSLFQMLSSRIWFITRKDLPCKYCTSFFSYSSSIIFRFTNLIDFSLLSRIHRLRL